MTNVETSTSRLMYVHPVIFDYKNMTHEPSTTDGEPTDRPNKRTNGLTDPNKDACIYKSEEKWGFYKKNNHQNQNCRQSLLPTALKQSAVQTKPTVLLFNSPFNQQQQFDLQREEKIIEFGSHSFLSRDKTGQDGKSK